MMYQNLFETRKPLPKVFFERVLINGMVKELKTLSLTE